MWCMVRSGWRGLDGWMVGRSGDDREEGLVLVLALILGDRFMGGEDAELVADGRRVLVRKGTAVGWLRVAEWCWLGLLRLVLGVGLRQAWERLGAGVGGVGTPPPL